MTQNNIVSFHNVTKEYQLYHSISYKEIILKRLQKKELRRKEIFTALQNISFDIKEGESVGIIGRNGSGKSTILGLIAKVLRPTLGTVEVKKRPSPLLELGGGFHPELNAYENIKLNGVLLGIPLSKINTKVEDIINFGEIREFANQPIRTYSSGMLARLGFSIITQLDPELLLIDEVLAVGDANFRNKCLEKMLSFKSKGTTIVLVSHNAEDIELICDRVIWIDKHQIKMEGKTEEILPIYRHFMGE